MLHWNIKIFGIVQNVGFRLWAKQKADTLGIMGLARNESDGTLYIEAEGPEDKLKEFWVWCKMGPAGAEVKDVQVHDGSPKKFKGFQSIYHTNGVVL